MGGSKRTGEDTIFTKKGERTQRRERTFSRKESIWGLDLEEEGEIGGKKKKKLLSF
jgi:hypothetical protein